MGMPVLPANWRQLGLANGAVALQGAAMAQAGLYRRQPPHQPDVGLLLQAEVTNPQLRRNQVAQNAARPHMAGGRPHGR